MFSTLLITFREGLEAFLMIAVAMMYLMKTNNSSLFSAIYTGLATSIIGSAIIGVVLSKMGALSPLWEGALAFLAAGIVISCVTHMLRLGKQMSRNITSGLATTLEKTPTWKAVFVFTCFMVSREGIESATMLASLVSSTNNTDMVLGGLIGLSLAGMLVTAWARFGRALNIALVFNTTAVVMVTFAVMLVLKGLFELTEINVLPYINNESLHDTLTPFVEGLYAQWASIFLVLGPFLWMLITYIQAPRTTVKF